MGEWRVWTGSAIVLLVPGTSAATEYLTVEAAQHALFPEASVFEPHHAVFTQEQVAEIEKQSGQKVSARGQQIWLAKKGDEVLGTVVVDYVIGKHLIIDYAVGILPSGEIRSVGVMQYRESYGGEIRNRDWLNQFCGKTAHSPLRFNDDITNISGATLSSRHVTEGIQRVLVTLDVVRRS